MAEPLGFHRHIDPNTIPGWRKVSRGLLWMLIASPIAHAAFLALYVSLGTTVPLLLMRGCGTVMEVGGFLFLYGLYLCSDGPRKAAIPSIALAALLTGFAAVAFSLAHLALWLSGHRADVPEDMEHIVLLLSVATVGAVVVSHLLCVWLTVAVRRYCKPGSSPATAIAYAAAVLVFVAALGAAAALPALLAFDPHGQHRGLSWRVYFHNDAVIIGLFVLSVGAVALNAWFILLVIGARKTIARMLTREAAVTGSLSSSSPSPP